jgi:hypothetical protein
MVVNTIRGDPARVVWRDRLMVIWVRNSRNVWTFRVGGSEAEGHRAKVDRV